MESTQQSFQVVAMIKDSTDSIFVVATALSLLILWTIVLFIFFKARAVVRGSATVVTPEYEPPKAIGPMYAHYILTSGRLGGKVGDVSISGAQMLAFIELYEKKLFQTLTIGDDFVEYKIAHDYRTQGDVLAEEIALLELIERECGVSGTLHFFVGKGRVDESGGYVELQSVWNKFRDYLYQRSVEDGFILKQKWGWYSLMRWFSVSLTFGVFFGVFIALIPYIGVFIALLFVLPVAIIVVGAGFVAQGVVTMIPVLTLIPHVYSVILFFLLFVSWFAWFMIIGQSVPVLNNIPTAAGRELIRRLRGYNMYLKTVDLNRVSFTFDYSDVRTLRTTFSWLVVFRIASDAHWDQWYQLVSNSGVVADMSK